MAHLDQERPDSQHPERSNKELWQRVKGRLRTEVGEDIFTSWFARMDLDGIEQDGVRLSVATRFLKTWTQSHYGEKVLLCWQAEMPTVRRIDIVVRSAVIKNTATPAKSPDPLPPARDSHKGEGSESRHPATPPGEPHAR